MTDNALNVDGLYKFYVTGLQRLVVVDHVSFSVSLGTSLSIMGPSGSGKTTLLGLCAGLDSPSGGEVELMGLSLATMSEDQRARVRNENVGFVFQNFQLMPTLTALENVMLPLELCRRSNPRSKALALLDRVGLADRGNHYPSQLSGGEQQRVALSRAFVNKPKILFADEPTGNLDEDNAELVIRLLFAMNAHDDTTLILVTHNPLLAKRTKQMLQMKGGKLITTTSA